jgi:ketosteroid isomerase-like protein
MSTGQSRVRPRHRGRRRAGTDDGPIRSAAGWGRVRERQGAQAGPQQADDLLRVRVGEAVGRDQVPGDDDASRGTVTSTGRTFEGTSIQVFRIRGGKIVLFRDYFNVGGLQDILAV